MLAGTFADAFGKAANTPDPFQSTRIVWGLFMAQVNYFILDNHRFDRNAFMSDVASQIRIGYGAEKAAEFNRFAFNEVGREY